MPKAAPSTRSSGHVTLSFGLVSGQATLYSGTVSDHGITRKEFVTTPVMEPVLSNTTGAQLLDRQGEPILLQAQVEVEDDDGSKRLVPATEDHPVGRGQVDKTTGQLLPLGSEVVKKIQTEFGPVYVEDHEIEALFTLTPDTLVIKEFEPQGNMRHFVPIGVLHLEPRKNGSGAKKAPDPAAVKILTVLLRAMKAKNALAVCDLTTRGKPKPCILMPDGKLWLIHYTDGTREQREMPKPAATGPHAVSDGDVAAMGAYIDTFWSAEPLDLVDERSEKIQALADEKAAAGEFEKPEEATVAAAPAAAPTVDLVALLAASVQQAKGEVAA